MVVTSSDFQKNFGQYKELAQREAVHVTSNGRESVVLLSAAEYQEFMEFKKSRYANRGEVSEEFKKVMNEFMDENAEILAALAK